MSAEAGSTGEEEKMMEERASAAENALSWELAEEEDCSEEELAWHTMVVATLGFAANWELNLGVEMDLERFVGIVSDIFAAYLSEQLRFCARSE